MRITSLKIENFRAVAELALEDLPNAIVLAGPNGCGKSSVLDAIRLLKSAYGQYHEQEWQWWFNEFQINIKNLSREAYRVLQDPSRPLVIAADIAIADAEKDFLSRQGEGLVQQLAWRRIVGGGTSVPGGKPVIAPTDRRVYGEAVQQAAGEMLARLREELGGSLLHAQLTMNAEGEVDVADSIALELVFSIYAPRDLGVIDYHGPNRSYGREQVGSVNLTITATDDRHRQSALYNTQNKYTNVKTEMASAYVQEVLAREAGVPRPDRSNIVETLQELFEVFFPGKAFLGPQPTTDGRLLFPVELENGLRHDIDELSSGEKEVLLGYLRLRNSAPSNSVILLDEPELHLNPRLIRGLPRFYQKHVGEALGNQLWMITHSDTLLREAVEEPAFAVFHMQPPTSVRKGENQAHLISVSEQLDRAVVDLVGDLASYSPRARIVLLEGGGDADVDQNILRQLFPEFTERVNLVSAGSRRRVRELHALLEQAAAEGRFRARFFSIVDRDFDGPGIGAAENRYSWDVYHIENYLLNATYIRAVIEGLALGGGIPTEQDIERELEICAQETMTTLVRLRMAQETNRVLVECISTAIDPTVRNVAPELRQAAERSVSRINRALDDTLPLDVLERQEAQIRSNLEEALGRGSWKSDFRGRDILRQFVSRMRLDVPYERFRNLIINRMRLDGHKPDGMRTVVEAILKA